MSRFVRTTPGWSQVDEGSGGLARVGGLALLSPLPGYCPSFSATHRGDGTAPRHLLGIELPQVAPLVFRGYEQIRRLEVSP